MTNEQKEKLLQKVVQWAKDRKIDTCTPLSQRVKRGEELLELENAMRDNDLEEIKDAIGDVFVCIVNENLINGDEDITLYLEYLDEEDVPASVDVFDALMYATFTPIEYLRDISNQYNLDIWECLEHAYNEIKDRYKRKQYAKYSYRRI